MMEAGCSSSLLPLLKLLQAGSQGHDARNAMQVTTEGGFDAAMEAPFVYGALDALAARSAAWAERRQHLLLDQAPPDKAVSMPEPHVVAADAAAAVKQVGKRHYWRLGFEPAPAALV